MYVYHIIIETKVTYLHIRYCQFFLLVWYEILAIMEHKTEEEKFILFQVWDEAS